MLDNPDDFVIIDGVIGLAEAFHRETIAEGVETTEHGLMLMRIGCDRAQGYGIARPMAADKFEKWIADYLPNEQWLACGRENNNSHEAQIKFINLVVNWWQQRFESQIYSTASNVEHWPIMDEHACHCGIWLHSAKTEQLFEEHWINEIDYAHSVLHKHALELQNKYLAGEIDAAKRGLGELQKYSTNMKERMKL